MNKGIISNIIMVVFLIIVLAILWSAWSSLKDTRIKLQAQQEKREELDRKDQAMNHYVDSLKSVINFLKEKETELASEREVYRLKLVALEQEFKKRLGSIDKLWEQKDFEKELNMAFPQWNNQFWEAMRSDSVHGIIVPRLFAGEVLEIKTELDNREGELVIKDSLIGNYRETIGFKDQEIDNITLQRDTVQTNYNNLYNEYGLLEKKYQKEVTSGWFKITPGNLISAGLGLGAGYAIGRSAAEN